MPESLTFLKAAEKALNEAGEPMHYLDITRAALDGGYLVTQGKTPEATLNAQIAVRIKTRDEQSIFIRVRPGVYGLRRWLKDGTLEPKDILQTAASGSRKMVRFYPLNSEVRFFLKLWNGTASEVVSGLIRSLYAQTGTPQEQVDWSEPDTWIDERLNGQERVLAWHIWEKSKKKISPRYIDGHWHFVTVYRLLEEDEKGLLRLSEAGQAFLQEPIGERVRLIDDDQGLLEILRFVAEAGAAAPADLLDDWLEFLHSETNIRSESTAKSYLSFRLRNLLAREYLEREGRLYVISKPGLDYLGRTAETGSDGKAQVDLETEIHRLQEDLRQQVREQIRSLIDEMDPTDFEKLVLRLLEAMDYQDTEHKGRSGDGGVDVVGTLEVGITKIQEVIQVKRQKATVGRPVLDSLRGSLYRHDAVQGTIVTNSKFSKGARDAAFDRGAAPIMLIDGDALIGLLIKHGIGVGKRPLEIWSLKSEDFIFTDED